MEVFCRNCGLTLLVAPKPLCTDNAAMAASLAYPKYKAGLFADLTLEPKPSLG
jgi:tRNA A37 threonylcarbamoyltransferase TsaD